jgi:hypothetical protein
VQAKHPPDTHNSSNNFLHLFPSKPHQAQDRHGDLAARSPQARGCAWWHLRPAIFSKNYDCREISGRKVLGKSGKGLHLSNADSVRWIITGLLQRRVTQLAERVDAAFPYAELTRG